MSEKATVWSVAQAKARLSEVIDRAREQGPQTITKMAALRVVVVSIEERTRKTKRKGHARRLLRAVSTARF
jgi:prevent-host-death family protein